MNRWPGASVAVVIPALNEERSLPLVLGDLPSGLRVVVVDNGSTDRTSAVAAEAGAEVVHEFRRGYGRACLAGLAHLSASPPEVVVFVDADYSDYPEDLPALVDPIFRGDAALVIGSRTRGAREDGALLPQARFGNALACTLMRWIYGAEWTDLGPFRAVRWDALQRLGMRDTNFGWTVEMQIRAARTRTPALEVPARYRKRVGTSKITGTVSGTVRAGYKILFTIFRHSL